MQWSSSSSKCPECLGWIQSICFTCIDRSISTLVFHHQAPALPFFNELLRPEKSGQKCSKFVAVKICQNDETYQNDAKWSIKHFAHVHTAVRTEGKQWAKVQFRRHQFIHYWRMGCDWCNGINGGYSSHLGLPATNEVGKKPIQSCLLVLFISSFLFTCWAVSTRPNITVFVK